jgi:outer membrane protein
MRKTGIFFWAMILGLALSAGVASAADKFAYVDLTKIINDYSKAKEYDKTLEVKQAAYKSEVEKMVADVKAFQDKLNLLNEKEKEAKKAEMDNKYKSLQEFERQKVGDLRKEQDEIMKELFKDINDAIKQYAEKEGYVMVFLDRALVYQDKNLDISDKIIAIINKAAKK